MLRRLLFTSILCLTGWTSSSNAALLEVCTFVDGCGPDFAMGATASYAYNGVDGGVLTLSSSDISSVAFLDGQLNAASTGFGNTNWKVTGATGGGEGFNMTFNVDINGNLIAGSNITMEGKVFKIDGGFQNAQSANNTVLDGTLITGGTINELGWNDSSFDFRGFINGTSLLTTAGYGTNLAGNFIFNTSESAIISWDQSWSANGTLDVVVPVPAAIWLFGSGLIALVSIARTKRSHA